MVAVSCVPLTKRRRPRAAVPAHHAVGREADAARRQRESRRLVDGGQRRADAISVNGAGPLSIRILDVNGASVRLPTTGCLIEIEILPIAQIDGRASLGRRCRRSCRVMARRRAG